MSQYMFLLSSFLLFCWLLTCRFDLIFPFFFITGEHCSSDNVNVWKHTERPTCRTPCPCNADKLYFKCRTYLVTENRKYTWNTSLKNSTQVIFTNTQNTKYEKRKRRKKNTFQGLFYKIWNGWNNGFKGKSICFRTERITKMTTSMKVYERKFDFVKRIEKVSLKRWSVDNIWHCCSSLSKHLRWWKRIYLKKIKQNKHDNKKRRGRRTENMLMASQVNVVHFFKPSEFSFSLLPLLTITVAVVVVL